MSRSSGRAPVRVLIVACAGLLTGLGAGPSSAQDGGGVSIGVGEADLYPSVRLGYFADSNVYSAESNEIEGSGVVLSPTLLFVADRRLLQLEARYTGDWRQGSEDVLESYDHRLELQADAQFDKRRRVNGAIEYRRGHDDPGFGLLRGGDTEVDEPVVYDQFGLGGNFRYGVVDARGNIEAGIAVRARQYANLDAITAGRDYTLVEPYGLFSYRLSGDTRALIELRYGVLTDDEDLYSRDELSLFGGVEFLATGRTRGSLRLGATKAAYDAAGREDRTVFASEMDIEYLLREYATLGLGFERSLDDAVREADGSSEQAVTDTLTVSWDHRWTSRISQEAVLSRSSTTVDCPEGDSVEVALGYALNYRLRRWLSFGAGVDGERRTGDDCDLTAATDSLDFERVVAGAHVEIRL